MAKNKMSYEALEKRMADVGFPAGTPENAEAVKQYRASAGIATKMSQPKGMATYDIPLTMGERGAYEPGRPSGLPDKGPARTTARAEYEKALNNSVKKAKGGKVSSASSRADGCAVKGKTKGRMV